MKIFFIVVVLLFLCGILACSASHDDDDLSTPESRKSEQSLLPTQVDLLDVETREQQEAWNYATSICRAETGIFPSDECLDALGEYFLQRPVWEYAVIKYYDKHGVLQTSESRLNPGAADAGIGHHNVDIKQIPLWRDIFDGRLARRNELFLATVLNSDCLPKPGISQFEIRHELNERCAAREMYIYAAYLDACNTAKYRLKDLRLDSPVARFFRQNEADGSELAAGENDRESKGSRPDEQWLEKGLRHAEWVARECMREHFVLLPNIVAEEMKNDDGSFILLDGFEPHDYIKQTHDAARNIAVRNGDAWAIHAYSASFLNAHKLKR